jgi:hypothetical protein
LIREKLLPITFYTKSNNLDKLCQYMQSIREAMNDESGGGKNVIFHHLIPAWSSISIKEPLYFPDNLQPFYVEGQKHKGKPLAEFNLPAAPQGLLNGVANILDARGRNTTAEIAGRLMTGVGAGWGVNGACLALGFGLGAVTGLGPFWMFPLWLGGAVVTVPPAGEAIQGTVRNYRESHILISSSLFPF